TTVLGQRFDEAGAPLDAQPFVIATGLTQGVRVAASDNAYLVVWKDSASTFARLIGEDGSLLSSIVTLPITGFVAQVDEVTSDGVNFALAVSGYSAQFVLLDPSLNTVAEESIAAQLPNVWPAVRVGWDGSRYVVLSRTDSGGPITGLSAAGEIVSTASLAACANAALACRPGSCLAVFDANGLTAQEIVAGLPVGPALSGPGSGSGVTQLDLVDTPTGFGLVLDQGGLSWIALDLPLPAGIPSGAPIAFIARQTASPVVSEAANGTLVLATDEAGCKAVFVDASGTAGAEWSDDSFVCAGGLLVNGANGYLQYGGGAARLLDAAGQPSADVQLPSGAELVLAYWDGAGYTTVLEGGSGPVLQRFSVTGQPDGAATSVSSQAFAAHSMIATPSGGLISFYDSAFDTVLRPIDASGSLGPAVNLGPIGLTTLAWGTANGVVAWTDGSNMFALHVDQQGAVLDPAPLTIPISVNTLNGVTGLGSLFVATAYAGGVAQVVRSQTFASAVVGPPIDVPAVSASIPVWCGVASVGNAAVPRAVVFTESYSSTYSAMRAQLFYLDLDPDGAPCTEDDQCASGDCADGVCCSVDCGTGGAGGSGAGGSAEAFGGAGGGSAQAAGGAGGAGAGLGEGGAPSSGGSPSDGGAGASDPSGTASGCDCSLSPRSSTEPLPLLLLFALFSRRRAGAGRSARPRSAAPR
ncbi:MAG: hypothetical protein JNK04_02875, partial [Myxococcales bacterium]|nr:hypothetical protein [Myxococcales bacterium]